MYINSKLENGSLVLGLSGELDANGAIHVDHEVKRAINNKFFNIVVDCRDLTYISSAGIGVFISYLEDLKYNKGNFVFINMSQRVHNVFRILGLEEVMTIVANKGM